MTIFFYPKVLWEDEKGSPVRDDIFVAPGFNPGLKCAREKAREDSNDRTMECDSAQPQRTIINRTALQIPLGMKFL